MIVTQSIGPGHTIVTIICDRGMSHLSKVYSAEYLSQHGLTPKALSRPMRLRVELMNKRRSKKTHCSNGHKGNAFSYGLQIVKLLNTSWSGVGPGLMHAATKGALQVGKPAGGLKIVRSSSSDRIAGVALPGGIGTLDEVFEILALIQLEWMGRCNGMKNFACQKAFQDLEMDALMSLWSGENYCEILVHDLCRCNGMKNFASHKAFRDLEMDVLMSIWSGENYCEILDHDL
uniref:Uncharacterized protein n=1 Tax=Quercus lobata TaxID=97700 RepID=A0A7N2M8E8_QUELO